jgi:hypothetical protein
MIRKVLVAAALVFAAFQPHVQAQDDSFTVRGVEVDVTAETASAARERAIAQAQSAAFKRLIARIVPAERQGSVPELDAKGIEDLVRDFEVDSEKVSAVRYLATLTVRFKPNAVRALLQRASVGFIETASKPLLVVPLYRAEGAMILWDDPNPWREAWARLKPSDGVVPLIVPKGDGADVRDLGPDQALKRDAERLDDIAGRYRAAGVLLAFATLRLDARTGRPVLDVSATRLGPALPEQTLVYTFGGKEDDTVAGILSEAVATVRTGVEDGWKRGNLVDYDRQASLTVTVPLNGLGDWLEIRKRLAKVAFVRRSEVKSLSRDRAVLALGYMGDMERLALALAQGDLTLADDGAGWTLSLGGARTDVAAPGERR